MSGLSKSKHGRFVPLHPNKCLNYNGEIFDHVQPILFKSSWEEIVCNFFDQTDSVLRWGYEIVQIPYYSSVEDKKRTYVLDFIAVIENERGELVKYAIEVKPGYQCESLDPTGNLVMPKPPKRKTAKKMAEWRDTCSAIRRNSDKWSSARDWSSQNGYVFKIITEDDIFGHSAL